MTERTKFPTPGCVDPGKPVAPQPIPQPATVAIAPVQLVTPGVDALERPGTLATVTGWGNTIRQPAGPGGGGVNYPDRMREAKVPLTSPGRVPVLVTQHMPPTFTTILAEHLGRVAGVPCHEPVDGEHIHAGTVYVAPGGKHMKVAQSSEGPVIRITDDPPVNFCKPAVDPLFYSARDLWGSHLLAVVLTGMGSDGARGALAIAEAGGAVIAQDEETSVVWGMPGATAHSGACSAVLPLSSIAPQLVSLVTGERS